MGRYSKPVARHVPDPPGGWLRTRNACGSTPHHPVSSGSASPDALAIHRNGARREIRTLTPKRPVLSRVRLPFRHLRFKSNHSRNLVRAVGFEPTLDSSSSYSLCLLGYARVSGAGVENRTRNQPRFKCGPVRQPALPRIGRPCGDRTLPDRLEGPVTSQKSNGRWFGGGSEDRTRASRLQRPTPSPEDPLQNGRGREN
jgi:hypothetical protein